MSPVSALTALDSIAPALISSKSWMFLKLFLIAKYMKYLTKGGIICISRSFRGTFFLCAGPHWSNVRSMITNRAADDVMVHSMYIIYMCLCVLLNS